MTLEQLERFHHLYERTAADLAKITTFSSEPETRRYLENLVARAYGEIHETRERPRPAAPLQWFFQTLPQTFRRHVRAFYLSLAITLAGCAFGGLALALDPAAKPVLMPFSHLQQDPAERVAEEESATHDRLAGSKTSFSAFLMTHNTRVSIFTLALGMTWGIGTDPHAVLQRRHARRDWRGLSCRAGQTQVSARLAAAAWRRLRFRPSSSPARPG